VLGRLGKKSQVDCGERVTATPSTSSNEDLDLAFVERSSSFARDGPALLDSRLGRRFFTRDEREYENSSEADTLSVTSATTAQTPDTLDTLDTLETEVSFKSPVKRAGGKDEGNDDAKKRK
jgi:hypothetical protein